MLVSTLRTLIPMCAFSAVIIIASVQYIREQQYVSMSHICQYAFVKIVDEEMNRDFRQRLETFLRPYYQDLDGASRFDDVERIAKTARRLYSPPSAEDERAFELLLLFHRLGPWLEKVGHLSRTLLGV